MGKRTKQTILTLFTVIFGILIFQIKRIPQDLSYHDFADKRSFFGILNASDVLSNLAILVAGVIGLIFLRRFDLKRTSREETSLWSLFFWSNIFVALFSAFYHLSPDNLRLAVDRLAMSLVFMSFFSLMLIERLDRVWGLKLAPLLLLTGALSVIYWIITEQRGVGDLRFYIFIQFASLILLIPMFILFPSSHPGKIYLYLALGFYALAKGVEISDRFLFNFFNQILSGHTLKHYFSGLSVFMVVLYLKKRSCSLKTLS